MTDPLEEMNMAFARSFAVTASTFAGPTPAAARASATPQQMYMDMAAQCPVHQVADGMYAAVGMDDVLFLNKHHDVRQASVYLGSDRPAIPLGLDGEEHRKYRRLLDPVFTAKRIAPLAGAVRDLANEMIDTFVEAGTVDAYMTWCEPLPSMIFLSIMGLPMTDLEQFLHFKRLTLGGADGNEVSEAEQAARRVEAVIWIQQYFNNDLDQREQEAEPRDDMIGWLLTTEVDGHRLSRLDMLDILGLLMIAGLDTVASSLACFLSFLARHPEHRRQIVADPSIIPSAVEELMRFESPVTDGFREIIADVTTPSGTTIPAGSIALISWAAANLDPAVFADPLIVDFARTPNTHIGFASGFHRCLGSHLARMEMRVALAVWHERIPDYSIEPGFELAYAGNPRAPHHLPLVWS